MEEPKKKTKRKPSRLGWRKIAFGDLHVDAFTLDRCVEVLRRVRELAIKYRAEVVCAGDFWNKRGVLSVRQLDVIQTELDAFAKDDVKIIFVPGNHDQVSRDGMIHGLRIFEPYPNITVVSEPRQIDGIWYVPWREEPEEQQALFKGLPAGSVVFGHGEVKGATANNGHKSEGRFVLGSVKHLKAVYLSHYHKRQRLGNVWYLGSPFEMNMGERNMPHGVAYITSESEPYFFDFDDFTKHWRFTWPQDRELFGSPRPQDVVEVLAPKTELRSPAFLRAVDQIEAEDVRPLPLSSPATKGAPSFALTIKDAADRYVDEFEKLPHGMDASELKAVGQAALAEVADVGTIVPLGNTVHFKSLRVENFCAVKDTVKMPLERLGTVLLRGKMGNGKTALAADALTWCLYGMTAPRKPGTSGGSIRADGVVHDAASKAVVRASLSLDDSSDVYEVERTKYRGKGGKIDVFKNGKPWGKAGISDAQALIHHIVGVDYDLWRTYVSLGQGEVQNFVTDANKRRTELLERAFQLAACPHAQVYARKQMKIIESGLAPLREKAAELAGRIVQAKSVDFSKESGRWENKQQADEDEQLTLMNTSQAEVRELGKHLVHEEGWVTRQGRLNASIDEVHARLRKSDDSANAGKLHAQIGSTRTERDLCVRRIAELRAQYTAMTGSRVCGSCGQPIPLTTLESHIQVIEDQIRTAQSEMSSLDTRVNNLQIELGKFSKGEATPTVHLTERLRELRQASDEASKALLAIGQLKVKHNGLMERYESARKTMSTLKSQKNPWEAKRQEHDRALKALLVEEETVASALALKDRELRLLKFWEDGFGPTGIPVLVLRTALYELEMHANTFLAKIMGGRLYVELAMLGDELDIKFFEYAEDGEVKERDYVQLSGGQRRCVQLAFVPFALGEMIFSRTGVCIPFLVIDELTTHLDPDTKPIVCAVLRELERETVLVIDHDPQVQGEFDVIYDVERGGKIRRAS